MAGEKQGAEDAKKPARGQSQRRADLAGDKTGRERAEGSHPNESGGV